MSALKEVTFNTLKYFKTDEIILPGDYSKKFEENAKKLSINLEDQDIILKELSLDKDKLDSIVKETNNNLTTLNNSTKKAQSAITNKDENAIALVQNDIATMQKQIEFLQKELFTDSLTKAYNRKWFSDYYLQNDHFPSDGYMVFIDLNDFKYINDNFGHIVGDMVLRYLSNYLQTELKEIAENYVVRYAGDEFIVIFEKESVSIDLEKRFEELQISLIKRKLKPKKGNNTASFSFTFSFGLTEFKKSDDFARIIEIADEKMYENKKKVKGQ